MTGTPLRRALAAGALALYALVAGLLVPLHAPGGEAGPRPAGAGVAVAADCHDRDCHEPTHRHGGHAHDPATCVSCAQARALSSEAPAPADAVPRPVRFRPAPVPGAALPASAARATHPARAPPALS